MEVNYKRVTACSLCGNQVDEVVDLPKFPITDIYVDEPDIAVVDQGFAICSTCGHGQLISAVDPEFLYGKSYAFRTTVGGSTGVNDNLRRILNDRKFDRIIEVGCNDCYLLNTLREYSSELIGIDPVLAGREDEFSDSQLTVIGDFVENVDLEKKPNTLYITSHVMEHLPNPRTMLDSLVDSAGDGSLFVFQFPGLDSLLQDWRFDQVYNHHLQYFSLYSMNYLIEAVGGRLVEHHVDPHYWGTLMVVFELGNANNVTGQKFTADSVLDKYRLFKARMRFTNTYLNSFEERKFGYGAALQVPVLSYHLGNDFSDFECIIDDDERKDMKYFLNLPVIIRYVGAGVDVDSAIVLVTAHNFSRKIVPKLVKMNPKRIILPNGGM